MLQQVRLVGKGFKIPDRRKIGGNVFDFFIFYLFIFMVSLNSFYVDIDINFKNT